MNKEFQEAAAIIEKLEERGYEAYFVGGSVRDYIMGRMLGDIDIATSATPKQIQHIFPKTVDVGAAHGTIIVVTKESSYEVTTFRTEGDYSDLRRPDEVTFVKSLQEDLKRRDFTMNAIAMTRNGTIIDPYQGKKDIKRRVIRTVGNATERFREDALRMLRAVRFCSQLEFQLHDDTFAAIKKDAVLLKNISVERKTAELEKLLKGRGIAASIAILLQSNLYSYLPFLHDKEDELLTLGKNSFWRLTNRSELWTAFVYLLKPTNVDDYLQAWKLPKKIIKSVRENLSIIETFLREGWHKELIYHSGWENSIEAHRVLAMLKLEQEESLQKIQEIYDRLPIYQLKDIALNGNDLVKLVNKKPGKWIAEILQQLEKEILEGKLANDAAVLKERVRLWQQKYDQSC